MRAFFNIDIEHPFEQPGPADAGWRFVVGWVAVNLCSMSCVDREVGDDRGTVLGVASSARQAGPSLGLALGASTPWIKGAVLDLKFVK